MENIDFEKSWETFGPDSDEVCCVCGNEKSKIETRFGYSVCKEHHRLTPVEISQITKYSRYIGDVNKISNKRNGRR